MKKIKKIHFVGIKGVGMTPLAIIAKEAGFKVSGSDIDDSFITDKALKEAMIPVTGFSKENVLDSDLIITTGANGGFRNLEVMEAKKINLPVWTQGQAVGEFMKGDIFNRSFEGISVAGTHGKTTTTAMLATVFKANGYDPTYVIGTSSIASLGLPGHFGKGRHFISEADEYSSEPIFDKTPKFMWQNPKLAIFTNIELDHPDLYKSEDELRIAFLKFANKLSKNSTLIVCGDDLQIKKLLKEYHGSVLTYGFSPQNDYVVKKVNISGLQTFFWLETKGSLLGEFSIKVSGEHNCLNATAAFVAAYESGISIEKVRESLKKFKGSKRRFEYVGKLQSGAMVFDDYAHHPTEIKKTLKAFRQAFPKSNIVCFFQPHTYSRTKILFDQFIDSFYDSDELIIGKIYASQREQPDDSVSSQRLVEAVSKYHSFVKFLPELEDMVKYIDQKNFGEDTVLITMGAGDIYKVKDKLEFKEKEM